jgi:hypothetical protein
MAPPLTPAPLPQLSHTWERDGFCLSMPLSHKREKFFFSTLISRGQGEFSETERPAAL